MFEAKPGLFIIKVDYVHLLKTADWQSKARNNKYLKTREHLKT